MHITRYTDYSLRVLMYLAVKGNELSTIRDIAESYSISKNHLMKVVQELSARGYIEAFRGKNGGIRLNKTPESINVGKLIRTLEKDQPVVECSGADNHCVITPTCKLKSVFSEALESFFQTLDNYSLADLVPLEAEIGFKQLLGIRVEYHE